MKDVKCPYCGAEQNINHDCDYGYEEDAHYEQQCFSCEKIFAYTTTISFNYDVNRADCLNGGDHKWKPRHIYPQLWPNARYCEACGLKEDGEIVSKEEQSRILG